MSGLTGLQHCKPLYTVEIDPVANIAATAVMSPRRATETVVAERNGYIAASEHEQQQNGHPLNPAAAAWNGDHPAVRESQRSNGHAVESAGKNDSQAPVLRRPFDVTYDNENFL